MTVEDCLLLIEVSHSLQQELNRRALDASQLTIQQAAVLRQVETAGGRATISQLASALGRASHSVSGMVTSLEDAELVDRVRSDGADRRQVWVSLRPEGKRRLAAYAQASHDLLPPSVNGLISSEEAERLMNVIQAISQTQN